MLFDDGVYGSTLVFDSYVLWLLRVVAGWVLLCFGGICVAGYLLFACLLVVDG